MEKEKPTTNLCEYCHYCIEEKQRCEKEQDLFFENNGYYFDDIIGDWVKCPNCF